MKIYDLSKEQTVLGSLLSEDTKEVLPKVVKIFGNLGKNVFYHENNRLIYQAIVDLHNRGDPVEIPSVNSYLKDKLKTEGLKTHLLDLLTQDLTPITTEHYAKELKELAIRRETEKLALEVATRVKDDTPTGSLIEKIQTGITGLRQELIETPEPITAKQLLETPLPENQYLIGQGLLPKQGYTMLVGKAKEGKTMQALQMSLCLAVGIPFLTKKGEKKGLFPVPEPKRTLFLLRENIDKTIQTFLEKQTTGLEEKLGKSIKKSLNLVRFARPKTTYLDLKEGSPELKNLLENYRPALVVIDPLSRFLTSDMSKMETAIKVANTIDSLGEEFGCAFLLLHHFRKLGKDDTEAADIFERITGSSGWRNCYVSCLALEPRHKRRSSHIKRLSFEFRTHEPIEPITVERNPDTLLFEQITEDEAFEGTSTVGGLVEIIAKDFKQGVKYRLITEMAAQKFGVTKRRIAELLKKGQEEGLIGKEKGKEGKYYSLSQTKFL